MIRLVLFDIDGTLLRTGGAGVRAWDRAFAIEFGIRDALAGLSVAGRTDSSLVRECFLRHGLEPTERNFRRFYDTYVFMLEHFLESSRGGACAGVIEFIRRMEELPVAPLIGLLTGNIRLGAEIKLRRYELWELFQMGAFGDENEDRNHLAALAQKRGSQLAGTPLHGSQILVVGDTPHDVKCAQAIQARSLAVGTGGYSCDELRACAPTWVAASLQEIHPRHVCGALDGAAHVAAQA